MRTTTTTTATAAAFCFVLFCCPCFFFPLVFFLFTSKSVEMCLLRKHRCRHFHRASKSESGTVVWPRPHLAEANFLTLSSYLFFSFFAVFFLCRHGQQSFIHKNSGINEWVCVRVKVYEWMSECYWGYQLQSAAGKSKRQRKTKRTQPEKWVSEEREGKREQTSGY